MVIQNKVNNTCQDVLACQYTCFKPSKLLAGLINNLGSYIVSYSRNNLYKTFLTNRQFHMFSNTQYYGNRNCSQPLYLFCLMRTLLSNRERYRPKKCFVADKTNCWSIKYIKEEQDETCKWFGNRLSQRFKKQVSQFISRYNDIDSNCIEENGLNEEMKEMIPKSLLPLTD